MPRRVVVVVLLLLFFFSPLLLLLLLQIFFEHNVLYSWCGEGVGTASYWIEIRLQQFFSVPEWHAILLSRLHCQGTMAVHAISQDRLVTGGISREMGEDFMKS